MPPNVQPEFRLSVEATGTHEIPLSVERLTRRLTVSASAWLYGMNPTSSSTPDGSRVAVWNDVSVVVTVPGNVCPPSAERRYCVVGPALPTSSLVDHDITTAR